MAPDMTNHAAPPPSPCINICHIDPASGYCRGCWRTLAEISAWTGLTTRAKQHLLTELARRRAN